MKGVDLTFDYRCVFEKIKNRNPARPRSNRRNIFNGETTPFQRGALFIVNRRLRKSTGVLNPF